MSEAHEGITEGEETNEEREMGLIKIRLMINRFPIDACIEIEACFG